MQWVKKQIKRAGEYLRGQSIQVMISVSFTLVSVLCMLVMGVLLYAQSADNMRHTILQENQQLVNQIGLNVTNYTHRMMQASSAMYYSVIKNADLSQPGAIDKEMNLVYDLYNDSLVSVAFFTQEGEMKGAAPIATLKENVDVTKQEWFTKATAKAENQHFSTPHVQNLFEENNIYRWVISLSRAVELTEKGSISRGVLLVDMNYTGIEQIFTQITADNDGYIYLIDSAGEIIYHPKQKLIYSGLYKENNLAAATYPEGIHEEAFEGQGRQVIVKTVGYTGWKVVSVIPNSEFAIGFSQMRLFAVAVIGFGIILLVIVNSFVSSRVANPIKKLDSSVRELEMGNLDLDIYIGGPHEIEHLGRTIRSVVEQMRGLMGDIIREQEDKRRSEFDALQAQINPHFLYNTLDSIVWMIESDRYEEAISMVTALASLFRISLSKGNTIIPLKAELQHARYYLHIQNIRYKNKFSVRTEVDPAIENCYTIKLIVQPLLENAIYHAMELMDGDGEIAICGYQKEGDIYIEIKDNGLGIPPEKLANILKGQPVGTKKGSGIGLKNVHQRIQLYYGHQYGLEIESELDMGTTVRIHLPKTYDAQKPPFNKEVTHT